MPKISFSLAAKINLLVSLILILLLAIVLELLLKKRQSDATVINLAGRQRMLSQKIAKDLYSLPFGSSSLEQIRADAQTLNLVHIGLVNGNGSLYLPALQNDELLRLFDEIEPYKQGLLDIIDQVEGPSMVTHFLSDISANESAFVGLMDQIVFKAEEVASQAIFNLKLWTRALAVLVIASLVFLYLNLIRPTIRGLGNTERSLINSRNTLELFVRHTPAAVAMFDMKMNYLVASERWYRDYGLNSDESIIGRNHYEVFPEIDKIPEWKEVHQRVLNGEVFETDKERFEREDGKVDWLRYELRPWKDFEGKIGGMIMFTEVITEQIELQMEVEKKAEALEKVNAELKNFIYIASHDLQEPLRTTMSFAGLLEDELNGVNKEVAQTSLGFIKENAQRMSDLVRSLLDYSLIGNKRDFEMVDCNDLLEEVKADLAFSIEESGAQIQYESLPKVRGLKLELRQLFQNLISNSMKFARPNLPSKISISAQEEEDHVHFAFSDNGIGIEEKYFKKIFEVFQRLHSKDEISGTGIGLANCKKIVHLHGGQIWLKSELGKGTTFHFTIKK